MVRALNGVTLAIFAISISLLSSTCYGEEIDVKWEIYQGKYFYAKTRLPEGAKVKVTVIDIQQATDIVYVIPKSGETFPKQNKVTVQQKGDRFNFKINDQGEVSIRADAPQKSDGNMLYFKSLTLKVVIDD